MPLALLVPCANPNCLAVLLDESADFGHELCAGCRHELLEGEET